MSRSQSSRSRSARSPRSRQPQPRPRQPRFPVFDRPPASKVLLLPRRPIELFAVVLPMKHVSAWVVAQIFTSQHQGQAFLRSFHHGDDNGPYGFLVRLSWSIGEGCMPAAIGGSGPTHGTQDTHAAHGEQGTANGRAAVA